MQRMGSKSKDKRCQALRVALKRGWGRRVVAGLVLACLLGASDRAAGAAREVLPTISRPDQFDGASDAASARLSDLRRAQREVAYRRGIDRDAPLRVQDDKPPAPNEIPLSFLYGKIELPVPDQEPVTKDVEPPTRIYDLALLAPQTGRTYRGARLVFRLNREDVIRVAGEHRRIRTIQADFGDGQGVREMRVDQDVVVSYADTGTKSLTFEVAYSDDTTAFAASSVEVIALSTPDPTETVSLTASIPYSGAPASGLIYIYKSGTHSGLRNPVIMVEGFDLDNSMDWDVLYDLLNQENLVERLRAAGRDLVVVNYGDAVTYIQRNAFLVVETLAYVAARRADPTDRLTLIGASMGGLVTRYALTWMEANAQPHHVDLYMTFDSPHTGANIPLGVQHFINFFANLPSLYRPAEAVAFRDGLDSPAARQMLLAHFTQSATTVQPHPWFTSFQQELANLGNYPSKPKLVAVSNGSGRGVTQPFGAGAQVIRYDYRSWLVDIRGDVYGLNSVTDTIFDGLFDTLAPFDETTEQIQRRSLYGYDNAPGGTRSSFTELADIDPGYGDIQALFSKHCFIPAASSVGLSKSYLKTDLGQVSNLEQLIPFDDHYLPPGNEEHVLVTPANADFFLDQILEPLPPDTTPCDIVVVGTPQVQPNPVSAGNVLSVSYTILNQGAGIAGVSTTKVQIKNAAGGQLLAPIFSVPELAAGASRTVTHQLTIPLTAAAGAYQAVVILDNYSVLNQTDDLNDITPGVAFAIETSSLCDITVQQAPVIQPATVTAGEFIDVVYTLTNLGPGASTASRTKVQVKTPSNSLITAPLFDAPLLAAGESRVVTNTLLISAQTAAGPYDVFVILDNFSELQQITEDNDYAPVAAFTVLSSGEPLPLGIDVSNWNGTIDWSQVAGTGQKKFAYIRASAGINTTDARFAQNAANAVAAGVTVGAYHFAYPEYFSAAAEAQKFLSVASNYVGYGFLPPVLDIEDSAVEDSYPSRLGVAGLTQWIVDWCTIVENATGMRPIIYTTRSYANTRFETRINRYPLWIAAYPTFADAHPGSLGPWATWTFLQYRVDPASQGTNPDTTVEPYTAGTCPGIAGYTDLNSFNGTANDLRRLTEDTLFAVTNLHPAMMVGANHTQTLTIKGRGFQAGAQVRLREPVFGIDAVRMPTYIDETTLTLNLNVGTDPVDWTVEVLQPTGAISPPYVLPVHAPIPELERVEPIVTLAGPDPVSVYMRGSTYHQDSVARWEGIDQATSARLSPGGLTIGLVAAVAATNHGPATLQVYSPGQGGGSSTGTTVHVLAEYAPLASPALVSHPSPNFESRPPGQVVDSIVIHTTESTYSSALSWLTSPTSQVSAHYLIGPDGTIAALVDPGQRAWHATYYNDRSIGIEVAGYAEQAGTWSPEVMQALERLVAWLVSEHPAIPVVHPFGSAADEGDCRFKAKGLIGHDQIQPGCDAGLATRQDPGPYFPWNDLVDRVSARLMRRADDQEHRRLIGMQADREAGLLQLTFEAGVGRDYQVWLSTNLVDWTSYGPAHRASEVQAALELPVADYQRFYLKVLASEEEP